MPHGDNEILLTPAQQVLWWGQKLSPDSPLYNMAMLFKFSEPIDHYCFEKAFQSLVSDCDVLRMVFHDKGGNGVAKILQEAEVLTESYDLSTADSKGIDHWLEERTQKCLELDQCCTDSVLLTLPGNRHAWYLKQHHLCADIASMALLYRYQLERYALLKQAQRPSLDPLPSFAAYAKGISSRTNQPKESQPIGATRDEIAFYGEKKRTHGTRSVRISHQMDKQSLEKLSQLIAVPGFAAISPDLARFRRSTRC